MLIDLCQIIFRVTGVNLRVVDLTSINSSTGTVIKYANAISENF